MERAALAKAMNDKLMQEYVIMLPLVDRGRVSAHSNTLGGVVLNVWDSELWNARRLVSHELTHVADRAGRFAAPV